MDIRAHLEGIARRAGCAGFGVGSADPYPGVRAQIDERIRSGKHGGLRFTFGDPVVATDVRRSFPWANSIVAVAVPYLPEAGSPGPGSSGSGRVARFAESDHYEGLRVALDALASDLRSRGARATVVVDDAALVDRAAAVRAGVGWWGKNTMVLVPGFGPWVLLGSIVTDERLAADPPMARDCGSCDACLPACPTGALVAPGVLDARRCLAAVLQKPGVIPVHLREAIGDRIYGCDDCLDACPPGRRLLGRALEQRGRHDVVEILGSDDATLRARYARFYLPRRHPRYLRRNALIVAGNTGGPEVRDVAVGYLGHPDWLLRAHAAWSVSVIGGPIANAALTAALAAEPDARVRREIREVRRGPRGHRSLRRLRFGP